MTKPLTVYKASAGSGKTFTLAVEYIKLLVSNPQSYRTILAVTFTNKATEEMKMRILSQLYGIWKRLPDSATYAGRICADLGMEPDEVARRAGTALQLLIHNYGYFRIETIDSFFQTVLRNLARELDLTANLRIELNDGQVEEMAVDRMIEELDTKSETLRLIMDYINDKIADDKSWNVIGQIKSFGKTIFRDFYKEDSRTLAVLTAGREFMTGYAARMRSEMDHACRTMERLADDFFAVLADEGLSAADLAYKESGVAGFFIKLKRGVMDESIVGKRVTDCLDLPEKWYSKGSPRRDVIHALALGPLTDLLRQALDERPRQWRRYKSAELTLRHLYQLRLLGGIERKVREMNEEANRFLLSDTQQLLHSLIQGSDSPFIFEKIGAQLEHVMIDEFQDTSSVQWRNFRVLLLECMSRAGAANLIVGDVKQSIYRWRSGDWRLLNDIGLQFERPAAQIAVESLTVNYRSSRRVVMFNNAFFTRAVEVECAALAEDLPAGTDSGAGQLRSAYADVEQSLPEDRGDGGYVSVLLLDGDDYERQMLDEVASTVAGLCRGGTVQGSTAILVRSNRHIPMIAARLTGQTPDVRIVSDEAFRLDASPAVCTIVRAMRLLTRPDDDLTRAALVRTFQTTAGTPRLPEEYDGHTAELAAMPLYDLAERLYALFRLGRLTGQGAYVCAFYDHLGAFTQDHTADIDSFLAEWERTIRHKTIQSDEADGIRLISIHKSKGLEFDNVIIPFCDWPLEKTNGNVLWCRPGVEPFSGLPLVPVDYSRKGMMGTIYEKDYLDEHLQNCVDNLNLLYVAFTRAARRLFVIGRRDAKGTRSQLIQTCLPDVAGQLGDAVITQEDGGTGPVDFRFGTDATGGTSRQDARRGHTGSLNVFMQPVEPLEIGIESFGNRTEFVQSNRSREFMEGGREEPAGSSPENRSSDDRREYIRTGNVLHRVFSKIRTSDDVDGAMKEIETEGLLDAGTERRITAMLRKRLAAPQVADWFSGRWQTYNECSILSADDSGTVTERRPDRVMAADGRTVVVDFKFGVPHDSHREQVREYMRLLEAMGHSGVEGYLWYVYSDRIERV